MFVSPIRDHAFFEQPQFQGLLIRLFNRNAEVNAEFDAAQR